MIRVTDEMKAAFRAAQERRASELVAEGAPLGGHDILDQGLAAVLAIVDPSPPWATHVRDADDCIWTRVPDAPMVWWHEDPVFGNRTAADIIREAGPVTWLAGAP